MTKREGFQLPYQPHLDGLRAVAVIAVIVYHFNPGLLPGGFLGVDVFFVLSGYLIAQILLNSFSNGTFSYGRFLERRFRRLAPSYFLVLLATSLWAIIVYSPSALTNYVTYAASAATGVSNLRSIFDEPYDQIGATQNPLLHLWSLGVEVQFYLVAPLLFLLSARLRAFKNNPAVLVGLLSIVSFGSAILSPLLISDQFNFYSPTSRMWELGVGMLAALLLPHVGPKLRGIWGPSVTPLGLAILGVSFWLLGGLSIGPGLATLIPIAATFLLIASPESTARRLVLENPIAVMGGKLSYGIYLWHYPLLAGLDHLVPDNSGWHRLIAVTLSVLLAYLSLRFIETPIRQHRRTNKAWSLPTPALAMPLVLILVFTLVVLSTRGFADLRPSFPSVSSSIFGHGPQELSSGNPGAIVIGDSIAETLAPGLRTVFEERGESFSVWTESACPVLLGVTRIHRDNDSDNSCTNNLQEERIAWVNSHAPSTVFLSARWPLYVEDTWFDNGEGGSDGADFERLFIPTGSETVSSDSQSEIIRAGLQRAIDELLASGHQVVLIYPIPETGWNVPERLASKHALWTWPPRDPLTTSYQVFLDRNAQSVRVLDSITGSILRFDPSPLFCNNPVPGRCVTHSDDAIFYKDSAHLTDSGAQKVIHDLLAFIEK